MDGPGAARFHAEPARPSAPALTLSLPIRAENHAHAAVLCSISRAFFAPRLSLNLAILLSLCWEFTACRVARLARNGHPSTLTKCVRVFASALRNKLALIGYRQDICIVHRKSLGE